MTQFFESTTLPRFEVRFVHSPDSVAICLIGELDMAGREVFERTVFPVASSKTRVVLDLSELRFVDCSGIGLLVEISNQLALAGIRLQLKGIRHEVQRVLDLTGTSLIGRRLKWSLSVHSDAIEQAGTALGRQGEMRRHG